MQINYPSSHHLRSKCAPPFFALLLVSAFQLAAQADYRDLIGFPELQSQLGTAIPTGSGIPVQHVEAPAGSGGYLSTNTASPTGEFVGKSISNLTLAASVPQVSTAISSHSQRVAGNFYGSTTSIAPDINTIDAYEATHWLGFSNNGTSLSTTSTGFLNTQSSSAPDTTAARISNHSWIGNLGSSSVDGEVLRRTDFVIDQDDLILVAGLPNSFNSDEPFFKSAYNEISVGRTDRNHRSSTIAVDSLYTAGRVAPNLVAPGFQPDNASIGTSFATPMVSAAAALLLETGQNSSLSNGTITNRTRTINYAETSEVIKAVLMAGADRQVDNLRGADLNDYAIDTANNLDLDYGAGQLNIFNSYNILAAGEQDSNEDAGAGADIGNYGWDYDPNFGGDAGTNDVGTYQFTASSNNDVLTATLAWNLEVDFANGNFTTTLHDLNLELFDVTNNSLVTGPGASSLSTTENTENVFFDGLVAGNQYELRVTTGINQTAIDTDYAIAWRIQTIPEPGTMALALITTLAVASQRRRLR